MGNWLPKDQAHIKQRLATKLEKLEKKQQLHKKGVITLDPSIVALQQLIPPAYQDDPTGKPQLRDFETMLGLVDMILKGPQWFDVQDPPTAMGLIGFPINAIPDWTMGPLAAYLFVMETQLNSTCLNQSSGWLSAEALNVLLAKGNDGKTDYTFQQLYECKPSRPFFGFTSSDMFFTRKFNPGIRPVASPDDQPTAEQPDPTQVIANACGSTSLQFATNVKLHDTFWLKEQPYSLAEMLDNHPETEQFVGGSVYQAFLRSYYSENLSQGFENPESPNAAAPNNSQPYISAVAARGITFVEADNPLYRVDGDWNRIDKGQLIGMFHFGGSTHCLVFRPQTTLASHKFVNPPPCDLNASSNNPVCSALAVVTPPPSSC
ncbi:uncharacterized protein Z519_04908 [Cladophialophora bantiana CBS 173.52]|uniref:L-tryptophan decarboxylase PsiD-like domain-containing protein n=1 Tax=Cladophialophora bantiana (strain ATCC 10958 / CBS 173.52 / CDC B-1940 / NIH 8579) TaxID=1442370 RepID=A0A0D2HNF5_CLAB1|nr:uncharacterized protein Z519_04908 [Cladophialophora bantiana CBS 173.52]KIW94928.1 hypothetical protein Z519_04908 [Cladophialophora bantiana CBS 173.52]